MGVDGLILVFQEIWAMVWRPNMLPCNNSAWQHWKQHSEKEAQRRLEKLQQSEVLYQWKFHRQTWTFQHTQLPGFHFFPSQQQDPTKMMILNGFGML